MDIKTLFTQNKKQFLYYVLGVLIITPSNIMVTFALANAFNMFEASASQEFINIALVSLALGFTPIILQVISRYLRIGFMRDVLVQVRMLSYKRLLNKTIDEFSQESMETYQSQLVSDINLFESDFFLSILNIIYSFGNFFLGILVLFVISPILALSTVVVSALLFILTKVFEKPTIERKQRVLKENSKFHQSLTNILNGLETIKLYQVMDKFKGTFYKDISELEKYKKSSTQINLVQKNIMSWISGTYQIFSIIYAAYLFSQGKIILTSLVVVFNLIGQLIWGMNNGFSMINRFKTAKEIYDNITQYEVTPSLEEKFKLKDKIEIKNLYYAYKDEPVLKDVNLTINNKDKVLIFGPSGTGKTTLVNTLSQNLIDYEGSIFYDEIELKEIDPKSFINNVGYVRQEHFIFDDTIKNNIILDKAYDKDKYMKVLKQAALDEWVESLELKSDHLLRDNGSNISGGERQRINIARELYQDKEILIFDEPSSSLDDQTSSKIYETIRNLDKTIIVISHRHLDFLAGSFDQVIDLRREGGVRDE
ncbi:MAG TPA: ABC transporter ATP-binding protein [Tissierellaceae bacterium]|nr:ABC transporter ATP-binding protein [Tissierellaceae bacterium]